MQTSIIAELVRDGKRAGLLRADLDASSAATCFVGMIQGLILRAQLFDEPRLLADEVEPVLSLWLNGARALSNEGDVEHREGGARDDAGGAGSSRPSLATAPTRDLDSLDTRPVLASGTDPLDAILAALATVVDGGVLTVTVPFRPGPLITLLRQRGHGVVDRQLADLLWSVDIVVGGKPVIEPLERVLEVASKLAPSAVYLARLPRFPRILVPHLRDRNVSFKIAPAEDGTALVRLEGKR